MEISDGVVNITAQNFVANLNGEAWKLIHGLPNCYEISTWGRVRFKIDRKNVIIKPYFDKNNLHIILSISPSENKEFKLSELVLSTFSKDYFIGCKVRFKDGNRKNVSLDNLRFKQPKQYHSSDNIGIAKWKCDRKANSANNRFVETTGERITKHDVYRVLEIMNFKCFYCDDNLDCNTWHLDHYIPVSNNGSNNFKNLAASCKICNTMKSDMDGNQFVMRISKLSKSNWFTQNEFT